MVLGHHSSGGKATGENGPATELERGSGVEFQPHELLEPGTLLLSHRPYVCAGHGCATNCDRLVEVLHLTIVHTRKVTVMHC